MIVEDVVGLRAVDGAGRRRNRDAEHAGEDEARQGATGHVTQLLESAEELPAFRTCASYFCSPTEARVSSRLDDKQSSPDECENH